MKIAMLNEEVALFTSFVCKSDSYFEFGCGGSTILAASLIAGEIYAVDSSKDWLEKVSLALGAPHDRCRLLHADIGPVRDWGFPTDNSNPETFLNYHERIWKDVPRDFSLYFVDGRFRVACFCQVLARSSSDAVVGVHDYRSRKNYHVIEEFARPIAESSDLTFFVRRPGVTPQRISHLLERYKYVAE